MAARLQVRRYAFLKVDAERVAADKYSVQMAGTAIVLQLISIFFCCGRCFVKSDSEPERFTFTSQISGACD